MKEKNGSAQPSGVLARGAEKKGPEDLSTKDLVLGMLAAGAPYKDIQKAVQLYCERTISMSGITWHREHHKDELATLRAEYVKNLMNLVPIANIVNRSLIRQRLITDLMKPSKLWRRVPRYYKGDLIGWTREGSHETINKILDSQAQEMSTIEDHQERRKLFEILKHTGNTAINFILYGDRMNKGD